MKKKIALVLVSVVLVAALAVGATLAWLTDTETVTNTFTVGKVGITLDESKVDVYGAKEGEVRVIANEYKLIPGHTYIKDPVVTVDEGSESSWLFIEVSQIIKEDAEFSDYISYKIDEVDAIEGTGVWTQLGETNVYYVKYDADTEPLVRTFNVILDGKIVAKNVDFTDMGISLSFTAYAIQADGFTDAAAAWAALKPST